MVAELLRQTAVLLVVPERDDDEILVGPVVPDHRADLFEVDVHIVVETAVAAYEVDVDPVEKGDLGVIEPDLRADREDELFRGVRPGELQRVRGGRRPLEVLVLERVFLPVDRETDKGPVLMPTLQTSCSRIDVQQSEGLVILHFQYM